MKKLSLLLLILGFSFKGICQNVGIGVTNPLNAKLHVATPNAISQGLFGDLGTGGLSLDNNEPLVGFNLYTNGSRKFMSNGWGSILYFERSTGKLRYNVSNASGLADATVPSFVSMFTIQSDGNVGIGTTTPTEAKLQIHEPAGNTQFIASAGSNLPGISTFVPVSSPSIGFNARYQSGYKFMGPGYGSFFQYSPSLGRLYYYYSSTSGAADGSISSVFGFAIDSSGQLGIGISNPKAPLHVSGNVIFGSSSIVPATGYKVSVDGKVICEELKVQLNASWPDYVFKKNYNLLPLKELEKSIMQNQHLPNIPSAAEVAKDGILVGDMNKRLLEKVEELTLYLIDLDKKNTQLTNEIADLKKQMLNINR